MPTLTMMVTVFRTPLMRSRLTPMRWSIPMVMAWAIPRTVTTTVMAYRIATMPSHSIPRNLLIQTVMASVIIATRMMTTIIFLMLLMNLRVVLNSWMMTVTGSLTVTMQMWMVTAFPRILLS